ncbi:hypothetical protein AGMMS50222_04660 [Endomicrobiia bacterium]|nr:hypothetical protein AGMMS49531_06410 [Endomicrobiia bacterium]GHT65430.1 hypothetical protein AGMMS49556_05260 [Endomicrobiia bacterium]GHT74816.1 hypothetical protein AGMMS50222_04660 [Endomicrobiia bacterium]
MFIEGLSKNIHVHTAFTKAVKVIKFAHRVNAASDVTADARAAAKAARSAISAARYAAFEAVYDKAIIDYKAANPGDAIVIATCAALAAAEASPDNNAAQAARAAAVAALACINVFAPTGSSYTPDRAVADTAAYAKKIDSTQNKDLADTANKAVEIVTILAAKANKWVKKA